MIQFRILGPFEVREDGQALDIGSRKQRALLAVLLLRAGEAVSVDELIDALWGARPPDRAVSSVHAYVSRLRRVLGRDRILRSGDGYRLQVDSDELDARSFEEGAARGRDQLQRDDTKRAGDTLRGALALWRGPPLADFAYERFAADEISRLEELRLEALEERIEADLAAGDNTRIVSELESLVRAHPFRERLVGQLMLALYRAGRQADALDLYERTRRALRDELGLQPSADLQRLAGEIVRQEPRLSSHTAAGRRRARLSTRRAIAVAVLAVGAIALVVAVIAASRDGGASPAAGRRVALVLPRQPSSRADTYVPLFVDGLRRAANEYRLTTTRLAADELDLDSPSVARTARQLRSGDFDLVIVTSATLATALAPVAYKLASTRFVFVDTSLDTSLPPRGLRPFRGLRNGTGLLFRDDQAAYLIGYLSGLIEARHGQRRNPQHIVSVIGGVRGFAPVEQLVDGFLRGARRALPDVRVLRAYSKTFVDQSTCEALANRQIDDGSDIVFAAAGTCSLGALRAAGIRGVWGIGVDGDRSYLGPHILASTLKRYDQAMLLVARAFTEGTLPAQRDLVLGLDDDAVGIALSPDVPESIRRDVARAEVALRNHVK